MVRCFLVTVALCSMLLAKAQNSFDVAFRNSVYVTGDEQFPFWFKTNRNGKIIPGSSYLNITELFAGQKTGLGKSPVSVSWGAGLVAGISSKSYLQMNQLYGAFSLRGWELKGGMFHDTLRFSGLSSTNGNFIRSMNARPYPMLRFSTAQNVKIPLTNGLLSFSAMYSEGLLNDNRLVDNPRLHQKSFRLNVHPSPTLDFRLGMEHVVMWGGESENSRIGKMPQDFSSYLRYVSGSRGSSKFPETDRLNVAGNQLGAWIFEVEKRTAGTVTTFYLNHPFEDFSGVNLRNWPDNLFGIHIRLKKDKPVNAVLYELTATKQQSIRDSLYAWNEETGKWSRLEYDNYFNHGVYQSGYTYHGQIMGSPLFIPGYKENGVSGGIKSNRFIAHHAGVAGSLASFLKWKGMLTWVTHYGTYANPYETKVTQLSGLLEFHYTDDFLPVELSLSAAVDSGKGTDSGRGIYLSVAKRW